jgi:hypothetical protein
MILGGIQLEKKDKMKTIKRAYSMETRFKVMAIRRG